MHPLVKVITEGLRIIGDGKGSKRNIFKRLQSSGYLSERGFFKASRRKIIAKMLIIDSKIYFISYIQNEKVNSWYTVCTFHSR